MTRPYFASWLEPSPRNSLGFATAMALLLALAALTATRFAPLAPRDVDAPAGTFSAARAFDALAFVLDGELPHPTGSPANAVVRERIVATLTGSGYAPDVRDALACSDWGTCADVRNVLARLPGSGAPGAVLLATHYDSVYAGPGASDDGVGVAVALEVARALRAGKPLPRDVIFLIDDGEEVGLLGAVAFTRDPWEDDVAAVVNVEARGSSGPSLMFETSPGSSALVEVFARSVRRPLTSSAFATAYDLLPNDTDFTVFQRHGYAGLNFAHIGNVEHYHTPRDDLARVSRASLQHHGENVLAVVRALASEDLPLPADRELVYFDLFGAFVARWPAWATLPLALLALAGLSAGGAQLLRAGGTSVSAVMWGAVAWGSMMLLPAAVSLLPEWFLHSVSGATAPATAHPQATRVALCCVGLAGSWSLALWFARRALPWGLWLGMWGGCAVVGTVLALSFEGFSFLFLVPALAAVLAAGSCDACRRPGSGWRAALCGLVPLAAMGALWMPMVRGLEDVTGLRLAPAVVFPLAASVAAAAPLLVAAPRRTMWRLVAGVAGVGAMALGVAATRPPYSPDHPAHLSIGYHEDTDSGDARWLATTWGDSPGEALRAAAGLGDEAVRPFPFTSQRWAAYSGEAPARRTPAPTVEVLNRETRPDGRRVTLRLRSQRGAGPLGLALPPDADVREAVVAGESVPRASKRFLRWSNGWNWITYETAPEEGFVLTLVLGNADPVEATVIDRRPGLPPEAAPLLRARPEFAVPVHGGDEWIVTRRVLL
ncbi:MAG: M20/M25/M40 family metallo-hydrolase [Myxococcota bacterium]